MISSWSTSISSTKSRATPETAHRLRLGNGARKAVEQVAVLAIQVLQALLHEADDDVVGDELPRVHDLLGGEPSGVPAFTAARSMSPVEICGIRK